LVERDRARALRRAEVTPAIVTVAPIAADAGVTLVTLAAP
jgi:hypothetical protein